MWAKKFTSVGQRLAFRPVMHHEKPTAHPFFHGVKGQATVCMTWESSVSEKLTNTSRACSLSRNEPVEKKLSCPLRKSGQIEPMLGVILLLDVLVHRAPQAESVSIFPSIHLPRFLASFRGRSPPAGRAVFAKHVVAPCAIDLTMFQSATQYEPNVHGLIGGKTHPDYHRMASNR